jgi:hypothetical protein
MSSFTIQKRANFLIVLFILLASLLTLFLLREISKKGILKGLLESSLERIFQADVELTGARIVLNPDLAVEGIGVNIKEGHGFIPVTIKKFSLSIDLNGLFKGKPTIGELTITEPTFFFSKRDGREGDFLRAPPFEKKLGITTFFIRSVHIKGGRLFFEDGTVGDRPVKLEFKGINLSLESTLFRRGMNFNFVSDVINKNTVSNLHMQGRVMARENLHFIKDSFWDVEGDFTGLDANAFRPYLDIPESLNIQRGSLNGDFDFRGTLSTDFSFFGSIESTDLDIRYPPYYKKALHPERTKVFLNMHYEENFLNIREFELNIDNVLFKGDIGVSVPLLNEGIVSGHVTSPWFSIPWLQKYLPDGESDFSSLSALLSKHIKKGEGKIEKAFFSGKRDDFFMPYVIGKKPIRIEMALKEIELQIQESLPPLSDVSGEFQLEGNDVILKDVHGIFGKTSIDKLNGLITAVTNSQPHLDVSFKSSLNLKDMQTFTSSVVFPDKWKKRLSMFSGWEGTTESNIHLETTLGEEQQMLQFKIISSLTDIGFKLKGVDLPFTRIKGVATITNKDFESELEGFLGNSTIEIKNYISGYGSDDLLIDVRAHFSGAGNDIKKLVTIPEGIVLEGWTPGSLSAIGHLNKFELKASLDLTSLVYGLENRFLKFQGLSNFLEIEGVFEKSDKLTISSAKYRLNGEEIQFTGEIDNLKDMSGSLVAHMDNIDVSKIKEPIPFLSISEPKGTISGTFSYVGSLLRKKGILKGEGKLLNLAFSLSPTSPRIKNLTADISFNGNDITIPYLYLHRGESVIKLSTEVKNLSHPQLTFKLSSPLFRKADFPPNEFIRALVRKFLKKTAEITGGVEIEQISLKSMNASYLKTDLSFKDRKWQASPLEFYTGGSKIEGSWERVPINGKDQTNVLKFKIVDGNTEQLIKEFLIKTTVVTGALDADVNVSWKGKSKEEVLNTLKGTIHTKFKGGRIYKLFEVLPKLLALINPLRIITLDLKEFEDQGMLYDSATGDFTIDNRFLETDNLIINGKEMKILWLGNVDIKTIEIDSIMAVQPFETIDEIIGETVGRIPLIGEIIVGKDRKLLVLYYKVTEDLRSPNVKGANIEELAKGINDRLRTLLLQSE